MPDLTIVNVALIVVQLILWTALLCILFTPGANEWFKPYTEQRLNERRLKDATYEQVRREFAEELAAATEYWAHDAVEKKIDNEAKRRLKEVASSRPL